MVQLIALLYKDQHESTLQKLLNLWLESSYSESSEDNESNTSPPPDQGSDDFSPVITSDPTSDSSDNGGNDRNKHNNGNNLKVTVRFLLRHRHLNVCYYYIIFLCFVVFFSFLR